MIRGRSVRVLGVGLFIAAVPLLVGSLRMTGRVIVPADEVVTEDLYAIADLVSIEGTVEGDVFAVTGELRITGTVDGDVIALVGGPTSIEGTVTGAVRVAGIRLGVSGSVGDDIAAVVVEGDIGGTVGRDVLLVGGEAVVTGSLGRDLRLQALRLNVDGDVGHDVAARVDSLRLGPAASIGGDVAYRASDDAEIATGASISGRLERREVLAPVWARAVTRLLSVLSLFALIVAGLAASWLFRSTSNGAVSAVRDDPWRSAAIGGLLVVVAPLAALPLFLSLVGIPVAIFILLVWLLALVLGPIPAVTQLGLLVMRGRRGPAVALVVGAVIWRGAIWALPLIGALIYLAALTLGLGAYARSGWSLRAEA